MKHSPKGNFSGGDPVRPEDRLSNHISPADLLKDSYYASIRGLSFEIHARSIIASAMDSGITGDKAIDLMLLASKAMTPTLSYEPVISEIPMDSPKAPEDIRRVITSVRWGTLTNLDKAAHRLPSWGLTQKQPDPMMLLAFPGVLTRWRISPLGINGQNPKGISVGLITDAGGLSRVAAATHHPIVQRLVAAQLWMDQGRAESLEDAYGDIGLDDNRVSHLMTEIARFIKEANLLGYRGGIQAQFDLVHPEKPVVLRPLRDSVCPISLDRYPWLDLFRVIFTACNEFSRSTRGTLDFVCHDFVGSSPRGLMPGHDSNGAPCLMGKPDPSLLYR